MNDPIRNNLARPQRYWYVDGLAEMAGGGVILLLGLTYAIGGLLPKGPWRGLVIGIGQPVIILCSAWAVRRVVSTLKERVTYPRTGYVQYRHPRGSNRWSRVLLIGFLAMAISIAVTLLGRGLPEQVWPAFTGLMLGLAIAYLGARIGLKRFFAVGFFSMLLGAVVCWLNPPYPWPYSLLFGLEGLAWIVCGALVLRHYLLSTRPLDAGNSDE
ncbi:hypothetical protein LARV_00083 [Longilinea arvoryzae]|uniref:Uncharacterized protein n=1 Tax=Longilinea arvoryzae TaxID=360412 RepID=A0A0S7B662_9CHLR|nr:hypothetical protein [Longilinea arvoryzae]GAP12350.1 hypothetical protein LARV_00083 [Longilinea arvoryzae]